MMSLDQQIATKSFQIKDSEIIFSKINTTNSNKLKEFQAAGLELTPCSVEIDEIQPTDPQNKLIKNGLYQEASVLIAEDKAKRAFQKLGEPVLIEDTSMYVSAAPNVTGPLIKQWLQTEAGLTQLCQLANSANNTAASAYFILAIASKDDCRSWVLHIPGKISPTPQGTNGFGWDPIFIPNPQKQTEILGGSLKTYAELTEDQIKLIAPRRLQVSKLLLKDLIPAK